MRKTLYSDPKIHTDPKESTGFSGIITLLPYADFIDFILIKIFIIIITYKTYNLDPRSAEYRFLCNNSNIRSLDVCKHSIKVLNMLQDKLSNPR